MIAKVILAKTGYYQHFHVNDFKNFSFNFGNISVKYDLVDVL